MMTADTQRMMTVSERRAYEGVREPGDVGDTQALDRSAVAVDVPVHLGFDTEALGLRARDALLPADVAHARLG